MRQLGTLSDSRYADLLVDYLLTQGIGAKIEPTDDKWAVWVKDEDQIEAARNFLHEFQQNPHDAKYTAAATQARAIRAESQQREIQYRRNFVQMRQNWNRPQLQSTPVVMALLLASVVVFSMTDWGRDWSRGAENSSVVAAVRFQSEGSASRTWQDISRGEVWRLVSPIFLHGDLLHLVFNASWLVSLGGQIERRQGSLCFALLVLIAAVGSNVAEALASGPNFGGMSGVVFAIVGYLYIMEQRRPDLRMQLGHTNLVLMVAVLVLGFTGLLNRATSGVANWAHAGGFLTGMAVASWFSLWQTFPRLPKFRR